MTTWVVSGSRPQILAPFTPAERHDVTRVLDAFLKAGDTLVQGGARGIDAIAMEHAHTRRLHVVTLLARSLDHTAQDTVSRCSDEVIETGVGYWARDDLEVERGDRVLAFPVFERERSSRYSGTWHTWDVAVRYRKHAALLVLRPRQGPLIVGPDWSVVRDALGAQLRMF